MILSTNLFRLQCTLIGFLCLSLLGCGPLGVRSIESEFAEETPYTSTNPAARMKEFEQLAVAATTPEAKADYTLLTIEWLIALNRIDEAEEKLAKADLHALAAGNQFRIPLVEAQLALANNKAPIALQKLPQHRPEYPWYIQMAILDTRATALAKLGYWNDSLKARLQLDRILQDSGPTNIKMVEKNQFAVWSLLQTVPDGMLETLDRRDPVVAGWVDLTRQVRIARETRGNLEQVLATWISRHKNHPAIHTIARALSSQADLIVPYPNRLALLLPLSGRLETAGKTVLNGFMAAHFNSDSTNRPVVRIYDTGDDPKQIWLHYQQALQDGADMIIGPLEKAAVTELVHSPRLQVPVLALNYADGDKTFSRFVIQFGLLPEDEARQAAELAIIKDQTHAIVFVPNTVFGTRLSETFIARYTELGGEILGVEKYSPNTNDHGDPIQRALNIQQSLNRNSILKTVLQRNLEFEPRRRGDAEAIFLIADPLQARNFRTQLKFYDSGDVSVYANSMVYSGSIDKQQDKDMDGIVFSDMPWTLQGKHNRQFANAMQYWPQLMQQNPRLYALGLDAYNIIPYLKLLKQNPFERFSGLTGNISLDTENQIHRELVWAVFEKGTPILMEFNKLQEHRLLDPEDDISYLQ